MDGQFSVRGSQGECPTMYLMIGLPASGKSSYCKQREHLQNVISLDLIKKRTKEQLLMDDAFSQRISFAVDNTNVTQVERARYIAQAKEHGYKVEGYYLQSVIGDCLQRNATRQGKARVPDVAILSKAKQLELPCYSEGFDQLWYVTIENGEFKEQQWKENE